MRALTPVVITGFMLSSCMTSVDNVVPDEPPALMSWNDLLSQDRPDPTLSLTYGDDPAQIVDLWKPEGAGPHPVVMMVHGGCWQKAIADRTLMNYAAEDLRQRGLAVWNIEYRGVDEDGGGYPGTFLDVSQATQLLFDEGPSLDLDVSRVVAYGHSAGGHLVAWLATQSNLPEGSLLRTGLGVPMKAVIVSGGLADLEVSKPVTLETCLANIMDDLTGQPDSARPNVFADTSPAEMLLPDALIINVNGEQDRIAPPELGEAFTLKIQSAGGDADYVEVPNSGHVELVAPGTEAFNVQAELMVRYLEED
ncbi:MAG: alpha/beta hydrolase [Pseudomonadota bacterium]